MIMIILYFWKGDAGGVGLFVCLFIGEEQSLNLQEGQAVLLEDF